MNEPPIAAAKEHPDALVLELPPDAGVRAAGDLRLAFLRAAATGKPVRLDLARVERIDLSTVQLLVALERALPPAPGSLALHAVPDAVAARLDASGFARWLPSPPRQETTP